MVKDQEMVVVLVMVVRKQEEEAMLVLVEDEVLLLVKEEATVLMEDLDVLLEPRVDGNEKPGRVWTEEGEIVFLKGTPEVLEALLAHGSALWMFNEVQIEERERKLIDVEILADEPLEDSIVYSDYRSLATLLLIRDIQSDSRTRNLVSVSRISDYVLFNEFVSMALAMVTEDKQVNWFSRNSLLKSVSAPEEGPKFFNDSSQLKKDLFPITSVVWADTLKRGLIDLNITAGFGFCIGRAKEDGPVNYRIRRVMKVTLTGICGHGNGQGPEVPIPKVQLY
ncbi:hypothetical protein C5167_043563 [Papaver somniferum]|uniref:Uncharacterized protein n=1 Tax=Papaver somniferum TaxID=3469 RepID=A0A4Y7L8P4_PAPSO|nr:hypothetical protein C5167_043563 [Papaver somniferum]